MVYDDLKFHLKVSPSYWWFFRLDGGVFEHPLLMPQDGYPFHSPEMTGSRKCKKREPLYRDLLEVTSKTLNYAENALPCLTALGTRTDDGRYVHLVARSRG
ncbi:MAG: hypothetical protein MJE77_08820 [Proteobacteria bacterium]|nr:hypothetical protein [Pseudomonadota bacterium]